MLQQYLPILLFFVLVTAVGVVPMLLAYLVAPRVDEPKKLDPYECGFAPFGDARLPFDVKYYLVAILFVLFDLETTFMFPWAVAFREIGWPGFAAMAVFLFILVVGFVFEWQQGALEWE